MKNYLDECMVTTSVRNFILLMILSALVGSMLVHLITTNRASATEGQARLKEEPAFIEVEMNVSAYCLCKECCGIWAEKGKVNGVRVTASGVPAVGLICAAPPEYPFGTEFEVDGVVYVCQDRGGAIKGNRLDILFTDIIDDKGKVVITGHQQALNFGRQQISVKVYK